MIGFQPNLLCFFRFRVEEDEDQSSCGLQEMEAVSPTRVIATDTPTVFSLCPYPQRPRREPNHGTWKSAHQHLRQRTVVDKTMGKRRL